jgi:hypothetical protein
MEYAQEREKCCVSEKLSGGAYNVIVLRNEEVDLPCNQEQISLFNMTGE